MGGEGKCFIWKLIDMKKGVEVFLFIVDIDSVWVILW